MNPPYYKIGADSPHAQIMQHIVHGQPNIYALFMALAAERLRPDGELIAITPRSFCNGPYFKTFRRWFLNHMSFKHIHLFESRTDTFRGANVLQENIITASQKTQNSQETIALTTSFGRNLPEKLPVQEILTRTIIDNSCGEQLIRVPENRNDLKIMELVDSWPKHFSLLDLRISTGPVVSFRSREYLRKSADNGNTAHLLSLHNVHPFKTIWPTAKNNRPGGFKICSGSLPLLLPTKNYVLLRRFSAKEEKRRLTASFFLKSGEKRSYVALEKEMATHSSVLAWRIPGSGEPGGLPSVVCTESDTTEVT